MTYHVISALVKRYVPDPGSVPVGSMFEDGRQLVTPPPSSEYPVGPARFVADFYGAPASPDAVS